MTTRTQLVIEGDLVTEITIESGEDYDGNLWEKQIRGKTVRVEAWLEKVMAQRGEQFFVSTLADGRIVARKTQGVRECVVVEFSPMIRKFIWSEHKRESENHLYRVAFPWVYLVFRFNNGAMDRMYVFYRNSQAEGFDSEMYLTNLPNVFGEWYSGSRTDYKICTGEIPDLSKMSFVQKLNWLIQKFWDSQFNGDLKKEHWNPSVNLDGHPKSFQEWEDMSRSNPNFILTIPWRKLGKTIQQLLNEGVA